MPILLLSQMLDRPIQWANMLEQFVALMFLLLIAIAAFLFNRVRDHIFNAIVERIRRSSRLRPSTAHGHKTINSLLNGQLHVTRAARALVNQFHNGDVYAMSNHSWKSSVTHEQVAYGMMPTIHASPPTLVSVIPDWVGPITSDDFDTHGFRRLPTHIADKGRRAYLVDVAAMDYSVARALCEQNGIAFALIVNLVDHKTSSAFGYVSLHFQRELNLAQAEEFLEELLNDAKRIEVYLGTDFANLSA